MKTPLGQSVLVETPRRRRHHRRRPRGARAPDGYTLCSAIGRATSARRALYPVRPWSGERSRADRARPVSSLMIVGRNGLPAKNAKELIGLAQGQSGQGASAAAWAPAAGGARLRPLLRAEDRNQVPVRVLPRRRAGDAGHAGRNDRHHVRGGVPDFGACRAGKIKAFAVWAANATPACPTCRPWRRWAPPEWISRSGMPVGAEGHTEGCRRQAQWRGGEGAGRSDRPETRRFARHDHPGKERADAAGAARLHKAELDKWWPIIKSYGIKVQ